MERAATIADILQVFIYYVLVIALDVYTYMNIATKSIQF